MQQVLEQLGSPVWWVGVVLVGLVINILSAYAKSPIDKLLSSISQRWKTRSAAAKQRFRDAVKEAAFDERLQRLYFAREARFRQREIVWLGYVCMSLLSGAITVRGTTAPDIISWASLAVLIYSSVESLRCRYYAELWGARAEASATIGREVEEQIARENAANQP